MLLSTQVVAPGLVSTSPAFVSSSASHPAGPHGRHAQKTVNRAPIDVCMCVVNKQFELLELFVSPFMLTCSMMRFLSLLLLGLCVCVVLVVLW